MKEELQKKKVLECLRHMWGIYHSGGKLVLKDVFKEHKVSIVPREKINDIITGNSYPTEDDAIEVLNKRRAYSKEHRNKKSEDPAEAKATPRQQDLPLDYHVELTEETCANFLIKTGNWILIHGKFFYGTNEKM